MDVDDVGTGGQVGEEAQVERPIPGDGQPSIYLALLNDAEEILRLQHLCYRSEAMLYDDWAIPPLTQTLASLSAEFATYRILAAKFDGTIVGSVRGRLNADTCHVGRLVVHPGARRRGLGARLMVAIEEVFTGHLSEGNLRLYRRLGYVETRQAMVSPRLTLVYLQKPSPT